MSDQLFDLLREADPAAAASPDPAKTAAQLAQILGSGQQPPAADQAIGASGPPQRRNPLRVVGATAGTGLAILVLVGGLFALVVVLGGGHGGDGTNPRYSAAEVTVAEHNPRLLVTASGWSVTQVVQATSEYGSMEFSDGDHRLELNWYPADSYQSYYDDRTPVDPDPTTIQVLGEDARTVNYGGTEFATMIPPTGDTFAEVRGDLGSYHAYVDVVSSLVPASVNVWLAALPGSVVAPDDRAQVVDEMLRGIPLPAGFDVDALKRSGDDLANSRVDLALRVTGAVTCAWLDIWTGQTGQGEQSRAEARRALDTAPSWPIIKEIQPKSVSAEGILDLADDGLDSSGFGRDTNPRYWGQLDCLRKLDRQAVSIAQVSRWDEFDPLRPWD
jgi:hypothetical protein